MLHTVLWEVQDFTLLAPPSATGPHRACSSVKPTLLALVLEDSSTSPVPAFPSLDFITMVLVPLPTQLARGKLLKNQSRLSPPTPTVAPPSLERPSGDSLLPRLSRSVTLTHSSMLHTVLWVAQGFTPPVLPTATGLHRAWASVTLTH